MTRSPKLPKEIEYSLYVYQRAEERDGAAYIVFDVQTTKEFTSFRYELHVDESFDKEAKEFVFTIGGMRTPSSLLPGIGTAQRKYEHTDLKSGTYKIKIVNPTGETNLFTLHLSKSELSTTRRASKDKPFIEIHTADPLTTA
jgi:hypothetical protein